MGKKQKAKIKEIEYSLKCWKSRLDYLERQVYYASTIIAKREKKLKTLKSKLKKEEGKCMV